MKQNSETINLKGESKRKGTKTKTETRTEYTLVISPR